MSASMSADVCIPVVIRIARINGGRDMVPAVLAIPEDVFDATNENQRLLLVSQYAFDDMKKVNDNQNNSGTLISVSGPDKIERLFFIESFSDHLDSSTEKLVRMVAATSPKPVTATGSTAKVIRRMLRDQAIERVGKGEINKCAA